MPPRAKAQADIAMGRFAYNPPVLSGGPRELRSRAASSLFGKFGALVDRAAFRPATLPGDLVIGLALLPPIVAGLVIFKVRAAEMLAVAVGAGVVGMVVGRLLWRHQRPRLGAGPLLAALFGVALVGAGASLAVSVEIVVLAVVLELLRSRYVPAIRAQAGLIAFAAVTLATRNATLVYFDPQGAANFRDPIATWDQLFHQSAWALDPIKLYVGDVPGPAFATSLLAVAVGVAWLAYARRVSMVALLAFFAGALAAIWYFKWDALFQLDSGPTWFVAGFLLANRRYLPESWALRPMLGFAAGLFAVGLRKSGYGIEAAYMTVATLQAVMAVVVLAYWAASIGMERWKRARRLRQREANLRAVKTISKAS
jgi:Na+-transporting NADH:ubiquinone oxidoreductase subunit NqrB